MKVWRIQRTADQPGRATRPYGVVSRSWGFDDSPDAEAVVPGYNSGKEYGAVAVGRHGSVLQWGFSAPPSKMTDAGRDFFINCICYIARFDGKAPLVRLQTGGHRFETVRQLKWKIQNPGDGLHSWVPTEVRKKYRGDPQKTFAYYRENYELIYWNPGDMTWRVDTDLIALGLKSNRELETLERLIALLEDREKAPLATRLLRRYCARTFDTPAEWQAWLAKNRDRIYFSDRGGYKFRVVPEGYLKTKTVTLFRNESPE